jgi:hypothetical protein
MDASPPLQDASVSNAPSSAPQPALPDAAPDSAAGSSAPLTPGHVSLAQNALARGLAALAALGAGATEEQTAAALLQASLEIRNTVMEPGAALEMLTPALPPPAAPGHAPLRRLDLHGASPNQATNSVLRLFSQLESDDGELGSIRAKARARSGGVRTFMLLRGQDADARAIARA